MWTDRRVGISQADAARVLAERGANELPAAKRRSTLAIGAELLREPMLVLLIVAGVVYFILGDLFEASMLAVALLAVIAISLYQEIRTERVLEALRDLTSPRALVLRDGAEIRIAGREVVLGDILVLREGDRIAADAILFEANNLRTDESLLTGESVTVAKTVSDELIPLARPGGEGLPFVYSGTLIVQGTGRAQVLATGVQTEVGRIGKALHALEAESSPLQRQTRALVRTLATIGITLSLIVVIIYGLQYGKWLAAILAGITLAMSILPEEYPVILIVFLALGAWRMSRLNVLTRRMPVLETLGEASVLCVDKTGTLTLNEMRVAAIDTHGTAVPWPDPDARGLVEAAMLASEPSPFDPMEKAFHTAAREIGIAPPEPQQLARRYPLQPSLLAVTQAWQLDPTARYRVAAKGAFEALSLLCRMDESERAAVRTRVEQMSAQGLRVLAVGEAIVEGALPDDPRDFHLQFRGLVALADPVRPGVPQALRECYAAGIRTVMITGDYPGTAVAIARSIGLERADVAAYGPDLDQMSDDELARIVSETNVFARIMPEQKLRIVRALKRQGEIVAMTGDGVNDAPALKAADIGIAMGGRGTDVAREAAALVLVNDDFNSIVAAIRQGRRVYANLKKAMQYLLIVHVPIAGMAVMPLLFGWPLFFVPIHVVFMEFIIDPTCAIAFEAESEEADTMRTPPRDPTAPLFSRAALLSTFAAGIGALLIPLASYGWLLERGATVEGARAFAFTTLILGNIALIFSVRSSASLWTNLTRPNPVLWWVVGAALLTLALALSVPLLQRVFQFDTLSPALLAAAVGLGVSTLVIFEAVKRIGFTRSLHHGS